MCCGFSKVVAILIEVSCRAFIISNNKILLCKQKMPPRTFWALPGGRLSDGETLVDCLQREILEELGVLVKVDKMLFIRELITDFRHRIEFLFLIANTDDLSFNDNITACNEIESVRFFSLDELSASEVKPKCLYDLALMYFNGQGPFPLHIGNAR